MTNETRRCLKCDGVAQGPLPAGALVCGAAVPSGEETSGLPKTDCDGEWFLTCTDESHPRGPHLHVPRGAVAVTDDRIVNAANTLAFPETDAGLERAVYCIRCRELATELSAFKARVGVLLKEIEWVRGDFAGYGACPKCELLCGLEWQHAPDCELEALLRGCGA